MIRRNIRALLGALKLVADAILGKNSYAFSSRGEKYLRKKKLEEAMTLFEKAIALYENNDFALARRGEIHRQIGQYDKALVDLNKAIAINKRSAIAYSSRGDVYRLLGLYSQSLTDFNLAIELEEDSWTYDGRGETYRLLGRYDEALTDFNRAIALDERSWIVTGRGETYLSMKAYNRAIEDFDRAIRLDANDALSLQLRGRAHWHRQQLDLALADLSQAITVDPSEPMHYAWHAYVLQQLNRSDQAKQSIDKALELKNDDAYSLYGRGAAFALSGDFVKAVISLQEAISREGQWRDIVKTDPIFDALRNSTEYQKFLEA